MNPDGISYLDMASGVLNGHSSDLINGYWSPGYPAILSVGLRIFRPSPTQEFSVVHFVNFFVFATALLAFAFFLRASLPRQNDRDNLNASTSPFFIAFAYSIFVWFMLDFIGLGLVTPDVCVATIVFLAAGICWNASETSAKLEHAVMLGCVLGIGYYTKAAMLPIGVALLGILFLAPKQNGWDRRKLLVSAFMLVLVAAPLIMLISKKEGHLTFGETGQLNYAWHVDGFPGISDIGDPSVYASLKHPPRILIDKPLTLEFATPLNGTYPLWSDPSYWYAGLKAPFVLRKQVAAIGKTLREYNGYLFRTIAFVSGAFVLWSISLLERPRTTVTRPISWQWVWPVAACSIYALVHVEDRYVASFLVLFWFAIYRVLLNRSTRIKSTPVLATVICITMGASIWNLQPGRLWTSYRIVRDQPIDTEPVVRSLNNWGIQSGDRIAIVGTGFYPDYEYPYYARVSRLKVVAQVPCAQDFWQLRTEELNLLISKLSALGVRAVIATDRPTYAGFTSWRDVIVPGGIRYSILLLEHKPELIADQKKQ